MIKEITCQLCGKEFRGWHNSMYCDECKVFANRMRTARAQKRKKLGKNDIIGVTVRHCKRCGKEFTIKNSQQLFCEDCRPFRAAEKNREKKARQWATDKEFRERRKKYLKAYQPQYQRAYYKKKKGAKKSEQ